MGKKGKVKWLILSVFRNCFYNKGKIHLGLKYRGVFYCISHSEGDIVIPKGYLKMKEISTKKEYLKLCVLKPIVLNQTSMKISEKFMNNQILERNLKKTTKYGK